MEEGAGASVIRLALGSLLPCLIQIIKSRVLSRVDNAASSLTYKQTQLPPPPPDEVNKTAATYNY